MRKCLLFFVALFTFDANASFFKDHSENGTCIKVINNSANEKFSLVVPEDSAVAIGEREITDKDIKKINEKDINKYLTCVSFYGQKESISTGKRVAYLKQNKKILLTLSFQFYYGQLELISVKKDTIPPDISIGMYRETDGGGVTYRLVIEESQGAIEAFDSSLQEDLIKFEIE